MKFEFLLVSEDASPPKAKTDTDITFNTQEGSLDYIKPGHLVPAILGSGVRKSRLQGHLAFLGTGLRSKLCEVDVVKRRNPCQMNLLCTLCLRKRR